MLRPAAYAMWEAIQDWFNRKIKSVGVENCLFPLFITKDKLEKEEEHVEVPLEWLLPRVSIICCRARLWHAHSGGRPQLWLNAPCGATAAQHWCNACSQSTV